MSIDRDTIRRLERLAGFTLAADEREAIAGDLERILAHFERIQSVDIRSAPPHAVPAPRLRDDAVHRGLDGEEMVEHAPDHDGPFFRVPPPFEQGEE